jgi:hypothetical protein
MVSLIVFGKQSIDLTKIGLMVSVSLVLEKELSTPKKILFNNWGHATPDIC